MAISSSTAPALGKRPQAFLVDAKGANGSGQVSLKALLVVTRVGRATMAATFQQYGSGLTAQTAVPDVQTVTNVLSAPVVRLASSQS